MLIYQAQSSRETSIFSNKEAAIRWVEKNAHYEPTTGAYWKENSPKSWVLTSHGSGYQVGVVFELVLETAGEEDPIRDLAFKILAGDPQACDAARDILRC